MLNFLYNNILFQQIDPRIYELEKDIEFYKIIIFGTFLVLVILLLIIILQRLSISRFKKTGKVLTVPGDADSGSEDFSDSEETNSTPDLPAAKVIIRPKELPDPGLIFKYSLAKENMTEKLITIGQTEGNIKTYSTEIINDHLSCFIRIIDNRR